MYLQNKAKRLISINTEMKAIKDKDGKTTNAENGKVYASG